MLPLQMAKVTQRLYRQTCVCLAAVQVGVPVCGKPNMGVFGCQQHNPDTSISLCPEITSDLVHFQAGRSVALFTVACNVMDLTDLLQHCLAHGLPVESLAGCDTPLPGSTVTVVIMLARCASSFQLVAGQHADQSDRILLGKSQLPVACHLCHEQLQQTPGLFVSAQSLATSETGRSVHHGFVL